jgi:hypothetical protein
VNYRVETIKTDEGWYAEISALGGASAGWSVETPTCSTAGAAANLALIAARSMGLKVTEWREEGE